MCVGIMILKEDNKMTQNLLSSHYDSEGKRDQSPEEYITGCILFVNLQFKAQEIPESLSIEKNEKAVARISMMKILFEVCIALAANFWPGFQLSTAFLILSQLISGQDSGLGQSQATNTAKQINILLYIASRLLNATHQQELIRLICK